ncbi:MAG: hypothetical protein MZV70_62700 [Desulfobacterales bacterium]|nr:hypothetical protein [Desulfobacterales bacterium]
MANGLSSAKVRPGKFELDDYDFTKPSAGPARSRGISNAAACACRTTRFMTTRASSSKAVTVSITFAREWRSSQYQFELCRGKTNSRGLSVGYLFKLHTAIRAATRTASTWWTARTTSWSTREYEAMGNAPAAAATPAVSRCCRASSRSVRGASRAEPVVEGPQTAVVVGPEGDEIYTDKYGRVKVQFHWDREGKRDENSSLLGARVRSPGRARAGAIDRDTAHRPGGGRGVPRRRPRPAARSPAASTTTSRCRPTTCPAHKSTTGIKSRGTKEGEQLNFNELRFEDDKGKEHIYLHGEKNMTTVVENSETHTVGNHLSTRVANNESHMVGKGADRADRRRAQHHDQRLRQSGGRRGPERRGRRNPEHRRRGQPEHTRRRQAHAQRRRQRHDDGQGAAERFDRWQPQAWRRRPRNRLRQGRAQHGDRRFGPHPGHQQCRPHLREALRHRGGGYTLTVGVKRSASIVGQDLLDVQGQRETKVLGPDTTTVTGPRSATVTTESVTSTTTMSLTAGATISLSATGTVTITSSGTTITAAGPVSITSASNVSITAPMMTLSAGAITLASPMVQCAGVLQAVVVIAGSVVSPTYTPGAGNLF